MHVAGEGWMLQTEVETAEQIDRQAAAWAARRDDAPFSEADQMQFEAWAGTDPRRLGAFARARAVALHSRRAAALDEGAVEEPRFPTRRALMAAGVAAVLVGGTGLAAAYLRRPQRFETLRGEIRTVPLDDGSSVTLSTLSQVSVRFSRNAREMVLAFGEVLFDVAADPARPFMVRAAGAALTADKGLFLLKQIDQQPLQITALTGALKVTPDDGPPHNIAPNHSLVLSGEGRGRVLRLDPRRTEGLLAWREGKLEFHDDRLSVAAAEFSRFRGAAIEFADAEVADMKITGLFEANDPATFARAVARSLNLRAEIGPERILLSQA